MILLLKKILLFSLNSGSILFSILLRVRCMNVKERVVVGRHGWQLVEWGADGVIIGSAVVKLLGESASPEEGLKALEKFAIQVRAALDSHLGET